MTYWKIISAAAKAAHVSSVLLYSICAHESRNFTLDFAEYDNGSPSYGVCQVKEKTAILMGYKGDAMALRNPVISTKYAALYLKYQEDRYGENWLKLVAAYNAGSYMPSKSNSLCPVNLKYVRLVQQKLPIVMQEMLKCDK